MIEVGTKDRVFVAVVLPIALVAAYFYGWRNDVATESSALDRELASLVQEHEFSNRRMEYIRQREISRFELEREKAIPMPPPKVKSVGDARQAEREENVYRIFCEAGLRVVSVEDAENSNGSIGAIIQNAGAMPQIACRVFSLEGSYGALVAALKTIAERELAVLPEMLDLRVGGRNLWEISIWL